MGKKPRSPEAYARLRRRKEKRMVTAPKCPDCYAQEGQPHAPLCDYAQAGRQIQQLASLGIQGGLPPWMQQVLGGVGYPMGLTAHTTVTSTRQDPSSFQYIVHGSGGAIIDDPITEEEKLKLRIENLQAALREIADGNSTLPASFIAKKALSENV